MKKELDDKLVKDFPNLYRKRNSSQQESCMARGFEIADGWFQLIYDLSAKLEKLILELPPEQRANCQAEQIKEKFGSLRVYINNGTDAMYKLINVAESCSANLCEKCGATGKLINKGYLMTLCIKCASK